MPCYTEPHSYCSHSKGECIEKGGQTLVKFYTDQVEYYKNQSDLTTSLLCGLCCKLEGELLDGVFIDGELKDWLEKHKKFDEKRGE